MSLLSSTGERLRRATQLWHASLAGTGQRFDLAQFHAVAGKVYELAKQAGLGREIPTEWFLQDIRD